MNSWLEALKQALNTKLWLFDSTGLVALVVLFALGLTYYLVCKTVIAFGPARYKQDWRESILYSAVIIGTASVIFVELLSAFGQLKGPWLAVCWISFAGLLALLLKLKKGARAGTPQTTADPRQAMALLKKKLRNLSLPEAIVGITLAFTFLVAYIAAPNNWDSMTYHMTKVAHWIQNASVEFFPTSNLRQLYLGPGAEYMILNFWLLVGEDRLANLVQWLSYLGSIIMVSLLVKQLGGNKKLQLFGALLAATIPMAILQSTSTQNDLVASFWILCCVNLLLMLGNKPGYWNSAMLAGALAMALLTKATSAIFLLPFIVWFGLKHILRYRLVGLGRLLIILTIVLSLYTPFALRNFAAFGSLMGPNMGAGKNPLANQEFGLRPTTSNLIKNMALHTVVGIERIDQLTLRAIHGAHKLMKWDIHKRELSFSGQPFRRPSKQGQVDEDLAGNPLHLLLLTAAILFLLLRRKNISPELKIYAVLALLTIIFFSGYLRWQVWGSRLQTPFFFLTAPIIALAIPLAKRYWLMLSLCALLAINCLPQLFNNHIRPLIPGKGSILATERLNQYFSHKPQLLFPYEKVIKDSSNCRQIGLLIGGDDFEYPLWVLKNKHNPKSRFQHVGVKNDSRSIENKRSPAYGQRPCAIISTMPISDFKYQNTLYFKKWGDEETGVTILAEKNDRS